EQRGRAEEMGHFSHAVSFAGVAEAMGCVGIRVERPDDIRPALEKALSASAPVVVEVISDVDAMSKRAWRPTAGGEKSRERIRRQGRLDHRIRSPAPDWPPPLLPLL